MKKIGVGLVILLIALILVSCSGDDTNADEYGNIMVYTIDDLPESGVFVKSEENYFPVMPTGSNLNGDEFPFDGSTMNPERFIWFVNMDHLVPIYDASKGHELVLRSSSFDVSQSIILEKFEDRGYTLGVAFQEAENTGLYKFTDSMICSGSSAAEVLNSAADINNLTVVGINDQKMTFGMLDASNTLINLLRNGVYELNIYQGTTYTAVNMVADCHIFFSGGNIQIEKFNLTRNGYAVIQLPDDFPEGIYSIAGYGLVKIV